MALFLDFLLHNWVIWAGFFITLAILVIYESKSRFGGAEKLSAPQVVRLINHAEGVIFDIRQANAFEAGHIKGALHIAPNTLSEQMKKFLRFKDKPVIIVADMTQNVAETAKVLIANGFSQTHVLGGGIDAWRQAGLPLSRAEKK